MKIKLALVSLALVVAAPVTSLAQSEAIPGKIGNVTISLIQTSDDWTEKLVKETNTIVQYQNQGKIVKAKYGNKEFIAALLAEEILPSGPATDWSLKYVETGEGKRFDSIFAVKKDGTIVNVSEGLYARNKDNSVESGKETNTHTFIGDETITRSYKGSYKEISTVSIQLYTGNDDGIELHGVVNESGTYDVTDNYETDSTTEKYTKGAVTYTGLSGGDDDGGPIFTGTISISALKDTADVSGFFAIAH